MTRIISSYDELLAAIAALPKPPKGTVRVFRGQTVDYPRLDPSGLRRSLRLMSIWSVYSGHLYSDILQSQDPGNMSLQDLQAHGLWFNALAQQYGPGSDFLDVTYSIDIALWFALNETRVSKLEGSIGPDGPPDPINDNPTSQDLVGYQPWEKEGYIYVFDLPLWHSDGLAEAGQIIDLAKAPEIFASSPRMKAQSGCLIYCRDKDFKPVDVRKHLVAGSPIRVKRPMTGTSALDRRVADIYPSPVQDEWYARLLSVPLTYSAQSSPPTLQRSIPVAVYYDRGNDRYLQEVSFHDVAVRSPLAHRFIPDLQKRPSPKDPSTTIILLEAPMIYPHPPADSDQWHHGLLWTDVPDRCPVYEFGAEEPSGEVSLASVFFEFSPLEAVGWDQAIRGRRTIELMRGVWLRRPGENLEAAIVDQEGPNAALRMIGFLPLFYDKSSRRIMMRLPKGEQQAIPIDELQQIGKLIIVGLLLLRNLSSVLKCQPTPSIVVDGSKMMVNCARDAARLYRAHQSAPHPDWFVLRDADKPEEPFTRATKLAGALSLETKLPFRDIPVEELRNLRMK